MTISVRRATVADAADLAAFGARVFSDTFAKDNTPEDLAAFLATSYGPERQRQEIESGTITLLAYSGETLVAFAQLIRGATDPCVTGEEPIQLARFYVDHSQHGTGVARELMEIVFDVARQTDAKTMWLGVWERNARAIRFYEKYGFIDVGSQPFLVGSDLQTDRVMQRAL